MSPVEFLSLFVPASLALNFYPGPNNVFALSNAARHGLGASLRASLGRQLAYGGLVAALALGLGALVTRSPDVFLALRLAAALFLVVIGLRLWLRSAPRPVAVDGRRRETAGRLFRDEFTVAFLNPKPLIVLLPFLPVLVAPDHLVSVGVLAAGLLFLALELAAAAAYGLAGRHLAAAADSPRGRLWIDRAGAISVVAAGLGLALSTLAG